MDCASLTAAAPQYFQATLVPVRGTITSQDAGESTYTYPNCPFLLSYTKPYSHQSTYVGLGYVSLAPGLRMLKQSNGKWIPATAKGPANGPEAVSSLNADGIVTTIDARYSSQMSAVDAELLAELRCCVPRSEVDLHERIKRGLESGLAAQGRMDRGNEAGQRTDHKSVTLTQ